MATAYGSKVSSNFDLINEMKTSNIKLDKFQLVFESISKNVIQSNFILNEMLSMQKLQFEHEKEKTLRDQLSSVDNSVSPKKEPVENVQPPTSPSYNEEEAANGWSTFFSTAIGTAFGSITGPLRNALARPMAKAMKVAVLSVIAPAVGEFVGSITEMSIKEMGFSSADAKEFGDRMNISAMAGTIGLAFGKRWGLVAGAATFAGTFGDDIVEAMGMNGDQELIAGMNLDQLSTGVMSILGGTLTAALTKEGLWKGIWDKATSETGFASIKKGLGPVIAATVMGLYITYGEDVKNYLKDNVGFNPTMANMTVDGLSFAATGASIGMYFGPQGAIIGAAIGLVVGLGKGIYDWFVSRREEANAKLDAAMGEVSSLNIAKTYADQGEEGVKKLLNLPNDVSGTAVMDRVVQTSPLSVSTGAMNTNATLDNNAIVNVSNIVNSLDKRIARAEEISTTELNAAYANLQNIYKSIENLSRSNPNEGTDEFTALQNIRQTGLDTRILELLAKLRDAGAEEKKTFEPLYKTKIGPAIPKKTSQGITPNYRPTVAKEINANAVASSANSKPTVIYAPSSTNAPVNNIRGGSSITTFNNSNRGNSDLDRGLPRTAN